jgi:signal peptidase II
MIRATLPGEPGGPISPQRATLEDASSQDPEPAGRPRRAASAWFFAAAAVLVLIADQVTKVAAENALAAHGASIPVIGRVVSLSRAHNTGAVFGLLPGSVGSLTIISLILCLAIVAFATHALGRSRLMTVALALTLGGAAGNLADRVWLGYVRDFLGIGFWPAFNLADAAITVGVLLVLAHLLAGGRREPA